MSQHSLNTDVNTALAALGSTMKGPSVPPAPLAGMLWLDDSATPWTLRIFDGTNWIPVGTVDASTNVFIADGLAAGRFFAPRANDTPDMKLRLNAGIVFDVVTSTLTGVISQETATLTAPSTSPRKDIVYIDRLTGVLGVATGTESGSPVDPAIPVGKLPVARINWTVGATAITTGMIDDIRVLNALGLGALAVQNFITDVPQNFALSGFLTPAMITATENNYNPSGLATVSTLRLSANAAHSITGLAGGAAGRILIVHNIDGGNITLENEHAGSTAGNRFALNSDITLAFNQAAILQYDNISQRWRAIAYQPTGVAPGGLSRSLRFNEADSANLNRTPQGVGNRRKWTWSGWVKRSRFNAGSSPEQCLFSAGPGGDNASLVQFKFDINDKLIFVLWSPNVFVTERTFRDPSAWWHVVLSVDTTNATAGDRAILYVNGVRETAFSTSNSISLDQDTAVNNAVDHRIGMSSWTAPNLYFSGYMTAVHFVDGQALDASAFGEFDENGTWMPKEYEGTYGNNGFWLDFADNSGTTATALGKDRSGNNNDWTPNNFSVAAGPGNDSLIDLPVNYDDGGNGRGNYCILSPLTASSFGTLSNGGLDFVGNTSTNSGNVWGTFKPATGKWYWECRVNGVSSDYPNIGIVEDPLNKGPINGAPGMAGGNGTSGLNIGGAGLREDRTLTYADGLTAANWSAADFSAGDIVSCALDSDNGAFYIGVNGVWQNSSNPSSGASKTGAAYSWAGGSKAMMPAMSVHTSSSGVSANFGQRPFAYPAPEGFKALNTQNLPAPAIAKPANYVNPVLYTGNGSTQTVSGVGFQPDLVWLKSRSNALDHKLTDAIRGTTKGLESNTADAESTDTNGLTAFTSNGFSLGSDATYNTNAATYVAWNWKTGVTPGFDILSYTGDGNSGRTVSHGLGVAPALVIVKNRDDNSTDWAVWHQALANSEGLNLNTQAGKFTATTYWNSTTPGSSVLTLGNSALVNGSTKSYVAYLWAEVPGFSKFGSYTGNGSSDGPFIWCGFAPTFVLARRTDAINNWSLYDSARSSYNQIDAFLYGNLSNAESSTSASAVDFLSNGFKARGNGSNLNDPGGSYIFAAFAEHPFKTARAR